MENKFKTYIVPTGMKTLIPFFLYLPILTKVKGIAVRGLHHCMIADPQSTIIMPYVEYENGRLWQRNKEGVWGFTQQKLLFDSSFRPYFLNCEGKYSWLGTDKSATVTREELVLLRGKEPPIDSFWFHLDDDEDD